MKVYEVGGAVRDRLLGRPVADRDWVVVGATPDTLLEAGYRQVGADFPVFLHPETNEEYALARTERKSAPGHRGFEAHASPDVTLEEDLARRDLTINAMARDADGSLIDPFGGRTDLENGILRHVTPAFAEDPLRVLRVARFAARLGFEVANETLELMRGIASSGELATLAPERVWNELRRALTETRPERFVEVLRACGACREVLPEVDRLFGVPQTARYHPEIDTGIHILLALAQAARFEASERVRFAVLVHDLGKAETPPDILPSHRGHEERGVALIEALSERLRVPREHRELGVLVSRYHTRVHRALEMRPVKLLALLESTDAFRRPERFGEFLEACTIDATGRAGLQDSTYPQADRLRAALAVAAAVSAREVAAGVEGAGVAEALREARLAALNRSETLS